MTHAAIINKNKGENRFTKLNKVFDSIKNVQLNYNWLITDCECYPNNTVLEENL